MEMNEVEYIMNYRQEEPHTYNAVGIQATGDRQGRGESTVIGTS